MCSISSFGEPSWLVDVQRQGNLPIRHFWASQFFAHFKLLGSVSHRFAVARSLACWTCSDTLILADSVTPQSLGRFTPSQILWNRSPYPVDWGGWGCEISCGGHHRPRGKTTTGSALDGAVFDIAQILAYLVHNMSRSQLYLGLAILADSLLF